MPPIRALGLSLLKTSITTGLSASAYFSSVKSRLNSGTSFFVTETAKAFEFNAGSNDVNAIELIEGNTESITAKKGSDTLLTLPAKSVCVAVYRRVCPLALTLAGESLMEVIAMFGDGVRC